MVSIHAPTRGATIIHHRPPVRVLHVSIHAPTRGATFPPMALAFLAMAFQSTHPHGVRLGGQPRGDKRRTVSIHAPTRGATQQLHVSCDSTISFNPRTHTGCDKQGCPGLSRPSCFNPRTHTGCDRCVSGNNGSVVNVSIHAPTRGATLSLLTRIPAEEVSIHAPTRGATL